jgi:hypothetical protein
MTHKNKHDSHFTVRVTPGPEMLHPRRSAQQVLLCDVCETVPLQSVCELCDINLCVNCVGIHLADFSKRHNVVHYAQRKSAPSH